MLRNPPKPQNPPLGMGQPLHGTACLARMDKGGNPRYSGDMTNETDPLEIAPEVDTHSVRATSEAYWTKGCGADQLAWMATQPWSSRYQGTVDHPLNCRCKGCQS